MTSPRQPDPTASASSDDLSLITVYLNALNRRDPRSRATALGTAVAVSVIAVIAAAVAGLTSNAVLVGAPAGMALFAAYIGWRDTLAPERTRVRISPHERWPLRSRRFAATVSALLAAVTVIVVGGALPPVLPGTFIVIIALLVWDMVRARPTDPPTTLPDGDGLD